MASALLLRCTMRERFLLVLTATLVVAGLDSTLGCSDGAPGDGLEVSEDPYTHGHQLDNAPLLEAGADETDANVPIAPGGGAPSVLVAGLRHPGAIAASGGEIYWLEETPVARVVRRATASGEAPRDLATVPSDATTLAVDASRVFWGARGVSSVPRGGGAITTVAQSQRATSLTLDGASLLFSTSDGSVVELPRAGGAMTSIVSGNGIAVDGVTADASAVYWVTDATSTGIVLGGDPVVLPNQAGALYARPRSGGITRRLASELVAPSQVIADGTFVYVSVYGKTGQTDGRVLRVAKSGGGAIEIARDQGGAFGLVLDATYVYWTTVEGGTVMRAKKDGSAPPDVLASGLARPQGIALDSAASVLYWTVRGVGSADGSVMRLAL